MAANGVTEPYILAVDVGTTSLKCQVYNQKAEIVGKCSEKVQKIFPQRGYVEIEPDILWEQFTAIVKSCIEDSKLSPDQITAMGISTNRATFITWNKETGKPYHNFISWNDTRAANYCEGINGSVSLKFLRVGAKMIHTVNRGRRWEAASSFAFSTQHVILRLAWILENVPGLREDVNDGKVLFGCLDTWLVWKLTKGTIHATDLSNISATGLYDLFIGNWNNIHMSYLRIPNHILPEIRDTSDDYGCCEKDIFGAAIPIRGLIADQTAAIFGQCCFDEGDIKVSMGTGTFLSVNTHKPCVPGQGCWPLVAWRIGDDQMCTLECNDSDTCGVIDWGINMGFYKDVIETESIAESVEDSGGVCFVPSFSGLQAPYENNTACCSFMGLTPATTPAHMVRAIMESVAFRVRQLHDVLEERSKVKLKSVLKFDGGVSNNNFILNLISRLLQKDIDRPSNLDMSLLGAAFMAGLSAGVWKTKEELKALRKTQKLITPENQHEEDQEMLEDWGRAVQRSLSWYAIGD
ncbi:glycerol kinase 5-like [Amphiura filiformis]|uniref:glycerol kinase 5-like n=1 Tax=Amphiura filiformis TaxID=82378 RepID=UPI003B218CD6